MYTDARIEDLEDSTFNPYLADELVFGDTLNPYETIHQLRAQGPVVEGTFSRVLGIPETPMPPHNKEFMVLSWEGVSQVLNDPITFSNHAFDASLGLAFGHTISVQDPPEHTANRKILQKAFRPNVVQAWGDGIVGPVIDQLMGAIKPAGKGELVEQFCRPYPFNVIYEMLQLPEENIETFYKLAMAQIITYPTMDNALDASVKLGRYFTRMIEQRRANPGTDVVSVVASAQVDGHSLPDDVVISLCRQLINAGGDTTFRTTTALLTGLLTNPDQLDEVRQDRELVPFAVEEALRWDGPVVKSMRLTTVDTVIDGVPVPANSWLDLMYGAANHDPVEFEDPEKFDIHRARHRHFGSAFGVHNCLGQLLARFEMTRALNAVLDYLPNVRLDPEYPIPQMRGGMMRTPRELHVVFD